MLLVYLQTAYVTQVLAKLSLKERAYACTRHVAPSQS